MLQSKNEHVSKRISKTSVLHCDTKTRKRSMQKDHVKSNCLWTSNVFIMMVLMMDLNVDIFCRCIRMVLVMRFRLAVGAFFCVAAAPLGLTLLRVVLDLDQLESTLRYVTHGI